MRLKIIDTNFTSQFEWLFKLVDTNENVSWIMNINFYSRNNLKSPVTKKELDYYDIGVWITASIIKIEGNSIVVEKES